MYVLVNCFDTFDDVSISRNKVVIAVTYSTLAKERGITDGINDTNFAPNQKENSDQFATFALRSIGESSFNYTQGTQLLIDKGIISQKQTNTNQRPLLT